MYVCKFLCVYTCICSQVYMFVFVGIRAPLRFVMPKMVGANLNVFVFAYVCLLCMYVYVRVCVWICIYSNVYMYIFVGIRAPFRLITPEIVGADMCVCECWCVCICLYCHVHICIYSCVCVHIRIFVRIRFLIRRHQGPIWSPRSHMHCRKRQNSVSKIRLLLHAL